MMQTIPYNLQQKEQEQQVKKKSVIKSKSLHKLEQEQLGFFSNSSRTTTSSSVDSEPKSTVADPDCVSELHRGIQPGSDNVVGGNGNGNGNGIGLDEWDSLFPNGDGSLLPWIMGDPDDDPGLGLKNVLNSCNNDNPSVLPGLNPGQLICGSVFPHQFEVAVGDDKPQIFNPQFVVNQQVVHGSLNPSIEMLPPGGTLGNYCEQFNEFQPNVKRHNPGVQNSGLGFEPGYNEMLLRGLGLGPQLFPQQFQQKHMMVQTGNFSVAQGVKDQLFKAAELIQTGSFSLAQEILARLNHQLSVPAKPPLVRAALYVKEALQMLLQLSNPVAASLPKMLTPYDVVHKMNAYKVFSEVSPITQFVNFTCTQAILEALDDAQAIHIVDFDIGCGAQWASFIQELPLRKRGAPSLRITAVIPPTTHPFELALIRENLVQFANDTGIRFELQVVYQDSFDSSSSTLPNFATSEDECVAVSIPIWSCSTRPSLLPSILRFIKERSPKVVVSLDKGFDRCDVPFPQHLIHSLESCTNLLESLDGLNIAPDVVSKVEKFFIQPRIENSLLGRLHAPNKMPHWKNLFSSAGLVPLQFSNFTETQADYVVKRTPGRGFHVEKRQASLVLSWQRRELVAASAWRC